MYMDANLSHICEPIIGFNADYSGEYTDQLLSAIIKDCHIRFTGYSL